MWWVEAVEHLKVCSHVDSTCLTHAWPQSILGKEGWVACRRWRQGHGETLITEYIQSAAAVVERLLPHVPMTVSPSRDGGCSDRRSTSCAADAGSPRARSRKTNLMRALLSGGVGMVLLIIVCGKPALSKATTIWL